MKVKPIKIKIKEPTPSAADRLYAKHQAIRKEKGLPDPSEYKKKLDNMKENKTTEVPTSLKPGHDEKKAKEVASKAKGNLVKGRQQSAGKDKAGKKLWWEEVEQLDELSSETKQSYKAKALLQIKELKPWTKKGEYKDLAKNMITKREKGVAKVDEQHVSGRFRPVKPHNVKSTATASPRPTSDSANVRLREADEVKPDQITTDSQKFPKKMSRKAQIVRNAAKKVPVDQFQANPILDSDVNPQTNKQ
jgi:hypothetical protein